jgi:S-DNA-T family DNA segregation ATPase FtsK/SpoIIIE
MKAKLIGLALMCAAAGVAILMQDWFLNLETLPVPARFALYWFCLLLPVIYLVILRQVRKARIARYFRLFEEAAFKCKSGAFPLFIRRKRDGIKEILTFKSVIPLSEWQKARERLETVLNCHIRLIEGGRNSKKIVHLTTLSMKYLIPDLIDWDDEFAEDDNGTIVIGVSHLKPLKFNLNATPHVLAAGETGSGKSVILRTMAWQMFMKGSRLVFLDFKGGVEFGKDWEAIGDVYLEREKALPILEMIVAENAARMALFRENKFKNLSDYNKKTGANLCRIGVFCDEIGEMLDSKGAPKSEKPIFDRLTAALSTLARLGRAQGINLFLGVQRPDANVLTGQIKNNVPVRISGRFADKAASEIVLGNGEACKLPDIKGRFLFRLGNETVEFQAYYFDDDRDLRDDEMLDVVQGDLLTQPPQEPHGEPQKIRKIHAEKIQTELREEDFDFEFD